MVKLKEEETYLLDRGVMVTVKEVELDKGTEWLVEEMDINTGETHKMKYEDLSELLQLLEVNPWR